MYVGAGFDRRELVTVFVLYIDTVSTVITQWKVNGAIECTLAGWAGAARMWSTYSSLSAVRVCSGETRAYLCIARCSPRRRRWTYDELRVPGSVSLVF